jgi:hypothetical protein
MMFQKLINAFILRQKELALQCLKVQCTKTFLIYSPPSSLPTPTWREPDIARKDRRGVRRGESSDVEEKPTPSPGRPSHRSQEKKGQKGEKFLTPSEIWNFDNYTGLTMKLLILNYFYF